MKYTILIAGSGGQGILLLGSVLAQAAIIKGMEATFFPSYGAEIRGGTAHSTVIVSDEEIGSPVVHNYSHMIILNDPSMQKFVNKLDSGGIIVYNASLIPQVPEHTASLLVPVPATEIAEKEVGSVRSANMVALGACTGSLWPDAKDSVELSITQTWNEKPALQDTNLAAFRKGFTYEHHTQKSPY